MDVNPQPLHSTVALRLHWREYLIEAWALGVFMISAGLFTTLFFWPGSPASTAIPNADLRRALVGIAMGLTAVALIYSPWGKLSGAHMNPAVTLTFWRLGKMSGWDAVFYIIAQFAGGVCGVWLTSYMLRDAFQAPPVSYVVTVPGAFGASGAFLAEFAISGFLMWVILRVSNTRRYARFTGLIAGLLVATYVAVEAPVSGMSMNPARTLASALPAGIWTDLWIYFTAPVLGMQVAGWTMTWRATPAPGCAKLLHSPEHRCIHCGHRPAGTGQRSSSFPERLQ
jgi:aquaporin Z